MYDISTFLTTSRINGAQTASNPAHLTDPGPSFSATGANLHTFPPCASPAPAICSTGTNLEQGLPHVDYSGDFEAPEDIKDPIQFALFDFVTCKPSDDIEAGDIAIGMAMRQAGRLRGFVADASGRTNAASF